MKYWEKHHNESFNVFPLTYHMYHCILHPSDNLSSNKTIRVHFRVFKKNLKQTRLKHSPCLRFSTNIKNIRSLYQITDSTAPVLQLYGSPKAPHAESRVERFCEHSLDLVQKVHAIRDAVKCKCSSCMVQVNTNTRWHRQRDVFTLIVVHEWEFGVGAVQAPGLVVPAQAAIIAISFTTDSSVGNSHVNLRALPVYFPVTAPSTQTLPAQHLKGKRNQRQNETFFNVGCWSHKLNLKMFS